MPDQASGILSPWLRKHRIKAVKPYLQGKILDYGCGIGTLADICSDKAYMGVDIDEESIRIATGKHPGLTFSTELPGDELFDIIVMLAVIEHIKEPVELLEKISSLLKPDGKILLTTPRPCVERIHRFGSRIGLFSNEACQEHETLFDRAGMNNILEKTGLTLLHYKCFLFGANQLFVVGHKTN
jgi:2-polyprenyl-3-methyl-5-hydroxy-6-metoxy-1,4-benzoquinol methylase